MLVHPVHENNSRLTVLPGVVNNQFEYFSGVQSASGTDISLAVTGIAGPDGGTADKPVGTVYLAMISPHEKRVERFNFSGNREQVRLRTACTALDWLRRQSMAQLSGGILEDEV